MNRLGCRLVVMALLAMPTLARGAVQATFVAQSPGPTTISVPADSLLVINVTFQNTGTVLWSNLVGNAGYVELCSTNQAGTQLVASPLAFNWLSTSSITKPTGSVLCTSGLPNAANSVGLRWTAVGDDGNVGRASRYDIRASLTTLTAVNWNSGLPLGNPPTPSVAGLRDSTIFTGLSPSTLYYFGVRAIDEANNIANVSNPASATTASASYTFPFSVKAPSTPGLYTLYIGLFHPGTSQIVSTPGPRIVLDVRAAGPIGPDVEAFAGQLGGNRFEDIMLYDRSAGTLSVALRDSTANRFLVQPSTWSTGYLGTLGPHLVQLVDYTGDGLCDVVAWEWNRGRIHGARNTGTGVGFTTFQVLVDSYHATSDSAQYTCLSGAFTPDTKADLMLVDKYLGRNFVLGSTGTTFTQSNGPEPDGAWIGDFAASPDPARYRVLASDVNGDRRTDLVYVDWLSGDTFGLTSSGSGLDFINGPNPFGAMLHDYGASTDPGFYQLVAGDFTGDQRGDLMFRAPDEARIYGTVGTGTSYVPVNGPGAFGAWLEGFHPLDSRDRFRILRAQETTDLKDDLIIWDRQDGRWSVAQATTNAFQSISGANAGGSWIDHWGPMSVVYNAVPLAVGDDSLHVGRLYAPAPNPCRASTAIRYTIAQTSRVILSVYDVSGRVVDRLVDQVQTPGQYTVLWRPANGLVSGMYFIRLDQADQAEVRKVAHIR